MSHLSKMAVSIKDIPTLTAAVKELGGELVQATTFFSYHNNHKCQYKIRIPGCKEEIGVIEEEVVDENILKATGRKVMVKQFGLHCDFYEEGQRLAGVFGQNLSKIKPAYAIHATIGAARKKGLMVSRQVVGGKTLLTLTGAALNH